MTVEVIDVTKPVEVISVGLQGPAGSPGGAGIEYLFGSGTPAGGLGLDDDVYQDTDTGTIYKKVTGSWVNQNITINSGFF